MHYAGTHIPNHDSYISFAHFIEMIDEILSTVDDTTFGESIATYFHSEKLKFYVMYFFRRGELE